MGKQVQALLAAVLFSLSCVSLLRAAEAKRPPEWDKIVEAARKEAKVVIAIPPTSSAASRKSPLREYLLCSPAAVARAVSPSTGTILLSKAIA